MTSSLKALINDVEAHRNRQTSYGLGVFSIAASAQEISEGRELFREKIGFDLCPEYLDLVATIGGFAVSGTIIYSIAKRHWVDPQSGTTLWSDWIVGENEGWRIDLKPFVNPWNWVIYGIGELEFIIQHVPSGRFQRRGRIDWKRILDEDETFEGILSKSLKHWLDLYKDA